jgi:hypothetical protein
MTIEERPGFKGHQHKIKEEREIKCWTDAEQIGFWPEWLKKIL